VRLALLGHPISHSLSPAMMTAAFRQSGIEGRYESIDIAPPLEAAHLENLHRQGCHGANVTVPHKESARSLAAEQTERARAIGAANVLVRIERGWRADNTDGPGFLDWIDSMEAAKQRLQRALVLGAGGSARAVVWALLEAGAARVRIAARTREKALRLARDFGERVEASNGREDVFEDALLVHCTPLGMQEGDPLPVPAEMLRRAGAVLDLVYPTSLLVQEARRNGIAAENGLPLLVAQGARAFHLWTGFNPDRANLLQAARTEASRRAARS
jgi:shikimate dehydrogenase